MLPTNTVVMQANVTLLVILQNFDAIGDLLKFVLLKVSVSRILFYKSMGMPQ